MKTYSMWAMEGINIRHQSSHELRADFLLKMMEPCLPMDTPKRRFSWWENVGFFLESEIFLATCQNFGALKKNPFQFRFFSFWAFFGVGFPGRPVFMLGPFPPKPTSKYLRRNLHKTAEKGRKKRGNKCKFEFWFGTLFAIKRIPKRLGFFDCETAFWFF